MDVQRITSSISGLVDSTGTAIGNPGTTEDTVLTLSGIGAASSVVFIFDNGVLLTPVSVTINGTWLFTETVALGRHEFTVRDSLGGVDSPSWVITVVATVVKPEIVSIVDSKGVLIPQNTDTSDTSVTLTGTATLNSTVELLDQAVVWATVPAPAGVWTKDYPGLAAGPHNMIARTGTSNTSDPWPFRAVTAPVFDLIRPRVPKAYGDGTSLNFDTAMYEDDYLSVIVNYTGMAPGQTIQLHWLGLVAYHSKIETVVTVGDIEFRVPRMEVVDIIGRAASITYTVNLADGTLVGTSVELPLKVDSQPFDLVPPTISADNGIVTVAYPGMNRPHTGRVRWSGVVKRYTGEQKLDARPENFDIPTAWGTENRGREVLINYTVYRGDGNHLLFSRVLRKHM